MHESRALILGLFFVVGLGMLIGGVCSVQHTRLFLQTAVGAPGVVTEKRLAGGADQRLGRVLVVLSAHPLPHTCHLPERCPASIGSGAFLGNELAEPLEVKLVFG